MEYFSYSVSRRKCYLSIEAGHACQANVNPCFVALFNLMGTNTFFLNFNADSYMLNDDPFVTCNIDIDHSLS